MTSRTQQALAWLAEDDTRTQVQAASRFGIAQATIAGAIARHREDCPACGQKLKEGAQVTPCPDVSTMAEAILTYAWHLGNCAAYNDSSAECTCGFSSAELAARSVC